MNSEFQYKYLYSFPVFHWKRGYNSGSISKLCLRQNVSEMLFLGDAAPLFLTFAILILDQFCRKEILAGLLLFKGTLFSISENVSLSKFHNLYK